MKLLLTAATPQEIQPVVQYLQERMYLNSRHQIGVIITGVGMVSATYQLSKQLLKSRPEIIIQAGIAGSFHLLHQPGTVVVVKDEVFGDMMAIENEEIKDLFDLNLVGWQDPPFINKKIVNTHQHLLDKCRLPIVSGITVNQITTNEQQIHRLIKKYNPAVESMEGAALHYVASLEKIPFLQLRSISNMVGERDKTKWKIATAIEVLNTELITIINKLI
ncbi:MAG: futalosine hydrolase [Sphingobacteriales bacterium]|nr:MAG: futalosine hydrolase [Sphingobacteriales bacterium]